MTVTFGLTAKKPGSAPNPTLVMEYGTTFRSVEDTLILGRGLI